MYSFTTSLAHTVYDAKLDAVRAVLYAALVDIVKMLQESRAGGTGGRAHWSKTILIVELK